MLSAMSGLTPPAGLANAVFRETEGNPFFVEEVYQHLHEEGKLFDETGSWKENLRIEETDVPEGVRLVIGRRLERLGEGARKILIAAAVIGRTFALDLLAAIVDVPDDTVLEAVEEAERAQLVIGRAVAREARYEFVHELIRTTLISALSLPRRQRLHLKIADAIERLRAGSLENHASVLAHHLYQAGAAADLQRTARSLMLALRRSIGASAFEEALETSDQLISLELADENPLLAETYEHRGRALSGLHRADEAIETLERAVALYEAQRNDGGISRAARALASRLLWQVRSPEAIGVLSRALNALSNPQSAEYADIEATFVVMSVPIGQVDAVWEHIERAEQTAERLGDQGLLARVVAQRAIAHHLCGEVAAARETGLRAISLLPKDELWVRANLVPGLISSMCDMGRLSEADAMVGACEAIGRRAGHHGATWVPRVVACNRQLFLTGNLRDALAFVEATIDVAPNPAIGRTLAGAMRVQLGEVAAGLAALATALDEQPPVHSHRGFIEASVLAAHAWADVATSRPLLSAVEPWLPAPGRRSRYGAWWALDTTVPALALLGQDARCGALYESCRAFIDTGLVSGSWSLGAGNPQLVAGISAHAAGLFDRAREHFEIARRQAHEVPHRLLQPTVDYWYGRLLSESADVAERMRGRAMIDAAAADFQRLELVLHARIAKRLLTSS
jgi:tetratricopeptide (TPR) repeat protein